MLRPLLHSLRFCFFLTLFWLGSGLLLVSPVQAAGGANPCDALFASGSTFYQDRVNQIVPIIPSELLGSNEMHAGKSTVSGCSPAYWNVEVFTFFAWKGIVFLNWLAGAIAIILISYGGVLYISASFSEGNAKKGKTMITGAITGLLIVIASRYLIYGAVDLFSNQGEGVLPVLSTNPFFSSH